MKKIIKGIIVGVIISLISSGIIIALHSYTTLLEGLEKGSINLRFKIRSDDPVERKIGFTGGKAVEYKPNPEAMKVPIFIVAIDEESIRRLGKFPWDRSYYALLVDNLSYEDDVIKKPASIFFDIFFTEESSEYKKVLNKIKYGHIIPNIYIKQIEDNLDKISEDDIFADSIKRSKVVFLDYPFHQRETTSEPLDIEKRVIPIERDVIPKKQVYGNLPVWVKAITPPIYKLGKYAKHEGFANIKPDEDTVNRRMPLIIKYKGKYYPSIDLLLAMNYLGANINDIRVKVGEYIEIRNCDKRKLISPESKKTGIIRIPIDEEGFMNINFIGGHASFLHDSFYKFILKPGCEKATPECFYRVKSRDDVIMDFGGKIVLVAVFNALGLVDVHKSPYGIMYGIEHHANTLYTILTQNFLYHATFLENVSLILTFAFVMGILVSNISITIGALLALIMILLYAILGYWIFASKSIIVWYSTGIISIVSSFVGIVIYKVLTEEKEKYKIKSMFSKYVSKEHVEQLIKNPEKLKLGGEKKLLTVLFSDVRSFTTISEAMTPEELVSHLNEYLSEMTKIVIDTGGTLDKYVGDEIMAFYGAPVEYPDHAYKACKAAVIMMDRLHELQEKWKKEGKPPLNIGIGINTGEMVVGNMGSEARMDYTVMGDAVNLGARLEGTNKMYGTNIIISEFTYEHVKDKVIVRELDFIRVKGKLKPVRIYELLDVLE